MTREEKERIQKTIKLIFEDVEFKLQKTVEIRDEYAAKISKIKNNEDFSDSYKQGQLQKLREELRGVLEQKRDEINNSVRKIQAYIKERDSGLDLNSTEFQNALLLIQTGGASLSYDDLTNIANTFEHDQRTLQTLKSVFKNQGLTTKPIDNLTYDADHLIDSIVRSSYPAFNPDGNLNGFAQAVNRLAKFENSAVKTLVDQTSFMNSVRLSAGLPVLD